MCLSKEQLTHQSDVNNLKIKQVTSRKIKAKLCTQHTKPNSNTITSKPKRQKHKSRSREFRAEKLPLIILSIEEKNVNLEAQIR